MIGAAVFIEGTNKGDVTNIDGQFALKVPPDTSLVISYIGYKTKKVHVSSLLHSDNNVIVLEDSREPMLDGIVAIATRPTCKGENKGNKDDVYGHRTYKPKSHKEKNKKKIVDINVFKDLIKFYKIEYKKLYIYNFLFIHCLHHIPYFEFHLFCSFSISPLQMSKM